MYLKPYTIVYTSTNDLSKVKTSDGTILQAVLDKLNSTMDKTEIVKIGQSLTSTTEILGWTVDEIEAGQKVVKNQESVLKHVSIIMSG